MRVNKLIGYGLSDVKTDGENIIDDRINVNVLECIYSGNGKSLLSFSHYVNEHAKENYIKVSIRDILKKGWKVYNSVIYYAEFGLSNVLLFQSLLTNNWTQRNSDIDYIEETVNHKQIPRYQVFERGIFPHINYMNAITHKRLDRTVFDWWQTYYYIIEGTNDVESMMISLTELSKKLGFKDFQEAKENIVPVIPEDIVLLCNWLGIFKDPNTVYQLRPMLYVYWS